MPTKWRRSRCPSCSSVRSSSSPTGSRASSPTSMPVTTASRRRSASNRTAPSPPGEIDDLTGIGPYSVYPRTSGIEANQIVNLTGGPYTCPNYRARARVVFQNKNVMCQYRAVGHPIATAVTEGLVELAAAKIGMDPLELRRRNLIPDDAHPSSGPSGIKFEALSHHECLAHLDAMMNYAGLRAEAEAAARAGHPSGHRVCLLHRGDQSERGVLRGRRERRSPPRTASPSSSTRRARHLPDRRHRAGPRGRGGDRAGCGHGLRGADRARARHHRRYR